MKPSDNLPDSFEARRYRPGTADADVVKAVVTGNNLVIQNQDGSSFNVRLDDMDIRLGGSHGDRIVFSNATTGDTIIVRDVNIVKALKSSSKDGQLQKQVSKMQSSQKFQKVQSVFGMIAVVVMCLMFGGCVLVAAILEPLRSITETNKTKEETPAEDSSNEAPSEEEQTKIEESYQQDVKAKIMKNWKLPPGNTSESDVVVRTKLDEKGSVKSFSVSESSGDIDLDNSAVQAVKTASPLPAPPKFWHQPVEFEIVLSPTEKRSAK